MDTNATKEARSAGIPWHFFLLAFAFSWACWGVSYLFARGGEGATGSTEDLLAGAPPGMLVMVLLGVFGPFVSAFWWTSKQRGREGVRELWKSGWRALPLRWLLVALLLFPIIRALSLLLSGAGISLEAFSQPLQLVALTLFMYFLGGSFGEEFGWRGYALPRLLERYNALVGSLILGAFWVLWHVPLFVIPGSPQAQIDFAPWALSVFTLAIIFTWVHVHVGGVVFAALLLHTMSNLSPELFRARTEVTDDWTRPEAFSLYLQVAVALAVLAIFGARRLRRSG